MGKSKAACIKSPFIKRLSNTTNLLIIILQSGLRIVYRVAEDAKAILVEAIGPRGDIYK